MFNLAYQLELLLTAARPLYLSEKTVRKNGPCFIRLEGRPGGWLFRKLLSLVGLAPAPQRVEVYRDRIEYGSDSLWFKSREKLTLSTICATGHQFFRCPVFLFLAWLCVIFGIVTFASSFNGEGDGKADRASSHRSYSDDDYGGYGGGHSLYAPPPSASHVLAQYGSGGDRGGSDDEPDMLSLVFSLVLIVAGITFFLLYFKVRAHIIYAYTNCGKGMLFAFQPRKSFLAPPSGAIDITLDEVDSIMDFIGSLIDANKTVARTAVSQSPAVTTVPDLPDAPDEPDSPNKFIIEQEDIAPESASSRHPLFTREELFSENGSRNNASGITGIRIPSGPGGIGTGSARIEEPEEKSRTVYQALGFFLGFLGIHDFYAERIVAGLIHVALFVVWLIFLRSCRKSDSLEPKDMEILSTVILGLGNVLFAWVEVFVNKKKDGKGNQMK